MLTISFRYAKRRNGKQIRHLCCGGHFHLHVVVFVTFRHGVVWVRRNSNVVEILQFPVHKTKLLKWF